MSLLSLEKFLALLVMPVGLLWVFIILTAWWCWHRQQRGPAMLLTLIAIACALFGSPICGRMLIASLENRIPLQDATSGQPFDAVLVLGGGTDIDGRGRPILAPGGDRVVQAARMWHAGTARVLVASGSCVGLHGETLDMGAATRSIWLDLGVPDSAILTIPEACWITREEIDAYKRFIERRRWTRVALVSSAWHLPRALNLASKRGLAFTPIGTDWRGVTQTFDIRDLIPQGNGFHLSQIACWEYLGRWIGR